MTPGVRRSHPAQRSGRRAVAGIALVVLLALIALFVFNRSGIVMIGSLRSERARIGEEIDSLRARVDSIRSEIGMLTGDSLYIEKLVRESLGWARPGEVVIRILERATVLVPLEPLERAPGGERDH